MSQSITAHTTHIHINRQFSVVATHICEKPENLRTQENPTQTSAEHIQYPDVGLKPTTTSYNVTHCTSMLLPY